MFGDNWDRHQNRFVRAFQQWEIKSDEKVDYFQQSIKGYAFNYVEGTDDDNPDIPWSGLNKSLLERYNNINLQKEVSERLCSMKYDEFHIKGEYTATTLYHVTTYIENGFMSVSSR